MPLAIFDLDNTLIAGDSDHRWGEFMCAAGRVDSDSFAAENDRFYADYVAGTLDIYAYLDFALGPVAGLTETEVSALQAQFMADWIEPIMLPKAEALIDRHRQAGDTLLIITATNTVVTRPIAERLGIPNLLGCEAERIDGRYTGGVVGIPSFREGKVQRLREWLAAETQTLDGAWFYSDSHNDLPLLEHVDRPVAVDPDDALRKHAEGQGWPVISLRDA